MVDGHGGGNFGIVHVSQPWRDKARVGATTMVAVEKDALKGHPLKDFLSRC
jgi:hypothetical protein